MIQRLEEEDNEVGELLLLLLTAAWWLWLVGSLLVVVAASSWLCSLVCSTQRAEGRSLGAKRGGVHVVS